MSRLRTTGYVGSPRVKPHFGSVEIDWGHSLAPDAVCVLLNEGVGQPVDLVSSTKLVQSAGGWGPSWLTKPRGVMFLSDGWNNKGECATLDPWNRIPLQKSYSIVLNLAFFGGQGDFQACVLGTVASGTYGSIRSTGGGQFTFFSSGWAATGGTVTLEKFTTLVGTASATETPALYQDGVLVGGPGAGDARLSATAPKKYFIGGTESGPTSNARIWIEQASVYSRSLSANDARWLTAEPYTFLRPIIRRRYFGVTAAAAPAQTIFQNDHVGQGIGRGVLVGR